MDNTTPAAAAPATDATPNTNSNPTADAITSEAPATPQPNIPAEQIEAFNKFVEANGGFDKAFGKMKQTISNPQPKAEASAQSIQQPQAPVEQPHAQVQQPVAPAKPAEGYVSANDIMALQYNRLMKEAYPELDSSYMDKGEYLKEASAMGVPVVDASGNFNDAAIRKFLDLKKAAIPATPTSTPITSTPTVEYKTIEGEISSVDQVRKVMEQGEGHPQYQQAVKFLKESIFGKPTEKK